MRQIPFLRLLTNFLRHQSDASYHIMNIATRSHKFICNEHVTIFGILMHIISGLVGNLSCAAPWCMSTLQPCMSMSFSLQILLRSIKRQAGSRIFFDIVFISLIESLRCDVNRRRSKPFRCSFFVMSLSLLSDLLSPDASTFCLNHIICLGHAFFTRVRSMIHGRTFQIQSQFSKLNFPNTIIDVVHPSSFLNLIHRHT